MTPSTNPLTHLSLTLAWRGPYEVVHTTVKQVAMVWACAAKRRHRLGEEMYGI